MWGALLAVPALLAVASQQPFLDPCPSMTTPSSEPSLVEASIDPEEARLELMASILGPDPGQASLCTPPESRAALVSYTDGMPDSSYVRFAITDDAVVVGTVDGESDHVLAERRFP